MQAEIASYVKTPMGAYLGHYGSAVQSHLPTKQSRDCEHNGCTHAHTPQQCENGSNCTTEWSCNSINFLLITTLHVQIGKGGHYLISSALSCICNHVALAISSFNCNNTGTKCVPSGSVVTCTCTVEDMEGIGSTQWDGSAFTGCPITSNEITLLHPSFTLRPQVICDDDAIVATPVSQEGVNYTSDVSIAVNTTTNGSIVRCSLAGRSPPVGMTTLKVGGKVACKQQKLKEKSNLFVVFHSILMTSTCTKFKRTMHACTIVRAQLAWALTGTMWLHIVLHEVLPREQFNIEVQYCSQILRQTSAGLAYCAAPTHESISSTCKYPSGSLQCKYPSGALRYVHAWALMRTHAGTWDLTSKSN